MYEAFFQLARRPFAATPNPDCLVPTPTMVRALRAVERALVEDAGFAVLTSPAGLGKTLLCRRLATSLPTGFRVAYVPSANFATRRAMLQSLLYELGEPYANRPEDELRFMLVEALRALGADGGRAVLLLDEAHLLGGRLLEELRLLSLQQRDAEPLASILLSGQLELEETLAEPGLEAVNQRIRCQVILESLTREESREYVVHRLAWAGGALADCFDEEAIRTICQVADGNPRALNQLCDHTLLLAYADERRPVDAARVTEAYEDLRQLPLHWNAPVIVSRSTEPQVASTETDDVPTAKLPTAETSTVDTDTINPDPIEHGVPAMAVEVGWGGEEDPATESGAEEAQPTTIEVGSFETESAEQPVGVFETPAPAETSPRSNVSAPPVRSVDAVDPETTLKETIMSVFQSRQTTSVLDCFDEPVLWTEEPVVDATGCRLDVVVREAVAIVAPKESLDDPTFEATECDTVTWDTPDDVVEIPSIADTSAGIAGGETYETVYETTVYETIDPAEFGAAACEVIDTYEIATVPEASEERSETGHAAEASTERAEATPVDVDVMDDPWALDDRNVTSTEEDDDVRAIDSDFDDERIEDSLPMLESALGAIVGPHDDDREIEETVADPEPLVDPFLHGFEDEPASDSTTSEDEADEWDTVLAEPEARFSNTSAQARDFDDDLESRIQRELAEIAAETARAVTRESASPIVFETIEPERIEAEPAATLEDKDVFDVVEPETEPEDLGIPATARPKPPVAPAERPYARLFSEIRRTWRDDVA